MSVSKFRKNVKLAMKKEMEGMKELAASLPNAKTDDPNTCLRWPFSKTWSALIEDELEASGYSVLFMHETIEHPRHFLITFSEETKEQIEEQIEEEQQERKRSRLDSSGDEPSLKRADGNLHWY